MKGTIKIKKCDINIQEINECNNVPTFEKSTDDRLDEIKSLLTILLDKMKESNR